MQKIKAIASARNFLEFENFNQLVYMSNIFPTIDWKHWEDYDGNRLVISKKKHIAIYPSNKPPSFTKDIFRKATPKIISKHSYWVLGLFGGDSSLLNFIGTDGLLRCCYFKNNIWEYNISPLLLGFDILKYIAINYLENEEHKLSSKEIGRKNKTISIEEAWSTGYPITGFGIGKEKICRQTL